MTGGLFVRWLLSGGFLPGAFDLEPNIWWCGYVLSVLLNNLTHYSISNKFYFIKHFTTFRPKYYTSQRATLAKKKHTAASLMMHESLKRNLNRYCFRAERSELSFENKKKIFNCSRFFLE